MQYLPDTRELLVHAPVRALPFLIETLARIDLRQRIQSGHPHNHPITVACLAIADTIKTREHATPQELFCLVATLGHRSSTFWQEHPDNTFKGANPNPFSRALIDVLNHLLLRAKLPECQPKQPDWMPRDVLREILAQIKKSPLPHQEKRWIKELDSLVRGILSFNPDPQITEGPLNYLALKLAAAMHTQGHYKARTYLEIYHVANNLSARQAMYSGQPRTNNDLSAVLELLNDLIYFELPERYWPIVPTEAYLTMTSPPTEE